jgi:hypothetical protein
MSSSSSTELREIAGFRLERELGRGRDTVVFEAIQVNLGRRVALKLMPGAGPTRLVWPQHPHVVSLYATGPCEDGRFVAMQLVRGRSLTELLEAGELDRPRALDLLTGVAAALDAAHGAGIAHGAVAAHNVLVDERGRALLTDFGLGCGPASVAGDRAAFAGLVRDCMGLPLPDDQPPGELVRLARRALPAPPRRRPRLPLLAAAGLVAIAAAAAFAARGGGGADDVPPLPSGTRALGSALAPGGVSSIDCTGAPATGASQACTVIQTRLPGRQVAPPAAGAIRSWTVRGAHGDLALNVVRRRGNRYFSVARSSFHTIPDGGVYELPGELPVRAGDQIGVELGPGASIGVRRGVAGAATARWLGRLYLEPRPIELGPGTGFDHELLVRVEYEPGAKPAATGELRGRAAAAAPSGRELASRTVETDAGLKRVAVVLLPRTVALDLFEGDRRLARLPAPDADPGGRLLNFLTVAGTHPSLRWRNPDGGVVSHEYDIGPRALTARN